MEIALLGRYVKARLEADPDFAPPAFVQLYATLGAQRATKILGIFARLDRRDGKPQYLRHIPRIWRYLQPLADASGAGDAARPGTSVHVPQRRQLNEMAGRTMTPTRAMVLAAGFGSACGR